MELEIQLTEYMIINEQICFLFKASYYRRIYNNVTITSHHMTETASKIYSTTSEVLTQLVPSPGQSKLHSLATSLSI